MIHPTAIVDPAARIKHLNVVGNTAFSDKDIEGDFESNTTNWTSWYSKDDQYSREKLSGDLEKLQSYYMLVKLSAQHNADVPSIFYLVKVDKARFNRVVVPGDQLRLEVEHKRRMRNMSQFWGRAYVGDQVAAEAEMLCAEVTNG